MNSSFFKPRYWLTWFLLFWLRMICFLPYRAAIYIGKGLGFLVYYLLPNRRRIADINLKLCYPEMSDADRAILLKKTMYANGIGLIEGIYSWWAADSQVLPRVHFKGLELLDQAKTNGQGVILLGAHYTTLDFCGRALAQNADMDIMYKAQTNEVFDYCLKNARIRGFKYAIEKNEMRRLLKNLKNKRVCWYACDQDFGRKNSVFAPFFGVPAATIATLSGLFRITNAKVLMIRNFRDSSQGLGNSQYHVEVFDPFADNLLTDDDHSNAVKINLALEESINMQPEQYFWVHRRFKRRPDANEVNPYR